MSFVPFLEAATQTATTGTKGNMWITVILYVVLLGGLFYFMLIRPQKKQQRQMDSLHAGMQVGDNIMTTGGFYGTIIGIQDDTVIVEFGNNKNCRIPMHKNAIAEVSSAAGDAPEEEVEEKEEKKGFFKKKEKDAE